MTAKKKPRVRPPLYFEVKKALVIDSATGVLADAPVGVLVPHSGIDRRIMRDRKFFTGKIVRGVITQARNYGQHKKAHKLAKLIATQFEGFSEDAHATLKRLQRESGVMCHTSDIDARPVINAVMAMLQTMLPGRDLDEVREAANHIKTVPVTEAESLSYDSMDEAQFQEFYSGLCRHIIEHYWPEITPEEIEQQAELMDDN